MYFVSIWKQMCLLITPMFLAVQADLSMCTAVLFTVHDLSAIQIWRLLHLFPSPLRFLPAYCEHVSVHYLSYYVSWKTDLHILLLLVEDWGVILSDVKHNRLKGIFSSQKYPGNLTNLASLPFNFSLCSFVDFPWQEMWFGMSGSNVYHFHRFIYFRLNVQYSEVENGYVLTITQTYLVGWPTHYCPSNIRVHHLRHVIVSNNITLCKVIVRKYKETVFWLLVGLNHKWKLLIHATLSS